MRPHFTSLLILLFCAFWHNSFAQQDSTSYKHQIGFNVGTAAGALWGQMGSALIEIMTSNQMPLEFCYKKALKNNRYLRLGTGFWHRYAYTDLPNTNVTDSNATYYINYNNYSTNGLILSATIGIEKQFFVSKRITFAFGADIIPRYTRTHYKRVIDYLFDNEIDGERTTLYVVNTKFITQHFQTLLLSPFIEMHYHLNKRWVLAAQSNLRVSFTRYRGHDRVKLNQTYSSSHDKYTGSQFALQANPVGNVALYYRF